MNDTQPDRYPPVDASPVKWFFVSMLTRDIKLEEAILDLLDNCVDGILRSRGRNGAKPYEGFKADIEFKTDSFSISDNCGGIPWSLSRICIQNSGYFSRYARVCWRVGIGMKRAILWRHTLELARICIQNGPITG